MKTLRKVKIEGFKSIEHAELMLGDRARLIATAATALMSQ